MEDLLNDTFGLDIRNAALTAVELEMKKSGVNLVNYSRAPLDPGIIDEDSILLNPEAFKDAVQKLLKNGGSGEITAKNVIISIPERKTFSHYLKVPTEDIESREAVLGHAKDFIPHSLSP